MYSIVTYSSVQRGEPYVEPVVVVVDVVDGHDVGGGGAALEADLVLDLAKVRGRLVLLDGVVALVAVAAVAMTVSAPRASYTVPKVPCPRVETIV